MLTIYRRHLAACKFRHLGRKHRNCQCPIWAAGVLHGRNIKQSLDLHSWEAAQKLVREWEAHPEGGAITVKRACGDYISDAEARNLSDSQMRKIRLILGELEKQYGNVSLRQLTVDDLRKIREAWKVAPITMSKRLEMLRSFFRFCVDSGWLDRNPAKVVRLPVVTFEPTLPFTEEEMENILWACDMVRDKHPMMDVGIEKRLKALVLLLRHSGLRITDAVILKKDRIKDGKLFLYQTKTKQPVWVPLPQLVLDALAEIEEPGTHYYFWSGTSKIRHAPTRWQDRFKKVFVIAGIEGGHAHRFRDTFAVALLEKGVDLKTVSMLLGHTSIKTTERHYAPWVRSRQLALEAAVQATFA
ncbi:MAG: tyrosine-type recombinase/integrase [Candidatus Binatia bacterium]